MPKFVTALYPSVQEAERAIQALRNAGFPGPDIQLIDESRVAEGFFDRLFIDENGTGESRDVSVMGLSRDDARVYTEWISKGAALVIAMCDRRRAEEARRSLNQFATVDVDELSKADLEEIRKRQHEVRTGRGGPVKPGEPTKWFRVVDVSERDPSEGVRSHAVHVKPMAHIHHISSGQMPGAHPSARFEEFETDFRVHYKENFTDSRYSFDDFKLGYLYGMALAQNRELEERKWSEIEEYVQHGWRDHSDKPWSLFGEAIRFGWRMIRSRKRQQQRRSR